MVSKSRKKKEEVGRSIRPIAIVKEEELKEEKEIKAFKRLPPEPPTQTNMPPGVSLIVKRMYFPGDAYSKNQEKFKKILASHGLAWDKKTYKIYTNDQTKMQIMSGVYSTDDQKKKVFAIYEGSNKPTTAIIKILGTGGNFLIDLQGFCHDIGCTFEDKDEMYINNVLLTLQEKGKIYVEKKLEEKELGNFQKEFNEIVKKYTDDYLAKWMDAYRESLIRRGLNPESIAKFRRMEIEDSVKLALESGLIENEWMKKYQGRTIKEEKEEKGIEKTKEVVIEKEIIPGTVEDMKKNFLEKLEKVIKENLSKTKNKYIGANIKDIIKDAKERGISLSMDDLVVHFKSKYITKIKNDYIYFQKII